MAAGDVQLTDPVDVFEFGPRVRNALDREDITTVEQLLACDRHRLLDIRSFGVTMLDEVVQTLAKHGLELKQVAEFRPIPYLPPASRVSSFRRRPGF
jgi:DNA-directed RNA polymerase alpha subunit